jgi:hypothetical protein
MPTSKPGALEPTQFGRKWYRGVLGYGVPPKNSVCDINLADVKAYIDTGEKVGDPTGAWMIKHNSVSVMAGSDRCSFLKQNPPKAPCEWPVFVAMDDPESTKWLKGNIQRSMN